MCESRPRASGDDSCFVFRCCLGESCLRPWCLAESCLGESCLAASNRIDWAYSLTVDLSLRGQLLESFQQLARKSFARPTRHFV